MKKAGSAGAQNHILQVYTCEFMATPATAMFVRGLDGLHRVRLQTVELIAPLSQQELDLVPAPGRWSVGEIVDHVILAADTWQQLLEDVLRLKRNGERPFVRRTFSDN